MSHRLVFLLNGEPTECAAPPQTTLLAWLRERRALTGTKEGCAEGDCGACTVIVAELDCERIAWKPVNACICLVPMLAGKAVFTVESLEGPDGTLHPVQQALVESHGSQCGFCTPGFAMSLFGLYKNAAHPTRAQVDEALSGNLCRCTGYRPILNAAQRMTELPAPDDWRAPVGTGNAHEKRLAEALAAIAPAGTLEGESGGQRWIVPDSEDALARALVEHPQARIVAGATDVGLWITKQHRDLGTMIFSRGARDMACIEDDGHGTTIGAAVSLTDAFAALEREYPELHEAWVRFASVPIRHAGTLGGNVANASPIGDSMPILIALRASVVLRRGDAGRELPIEDFFIGYQKTALVPGEFVSRIRVPRRAPGTIVRAYKVSKRFDQDISAVFACFALRVADGIVRDARIGCGGVAATPIRAKRTEAALVGQPWSEATAQHAATVIAGEFQPIDDLRASARYRREVLGNLVLRLWHETNPHAPAVTRVHELREWVP